MEKKTAAVFMAVCLLGAMPGAVWAADTADGLESSISDSETKKQELEQKNAELSQALEEAKQKRGGSGSPAPGVSGQNRCAGSADRGSLCPGFPAG